MSYPTPYTPRQAPTISGNDLKYLQDELRALQTTLSGVIDMLPQEVKVPPATPRPGMVRRALAPWRPVSGQASDAWVSYAFRNGLLGLPHDVRTLMRFFQKIAVNVDVLPLAHALQKHPDLWNAQRFRTEFPGTPHVDVDDIWLRFSTEEATADSQNVGRVIGDANVVFHQAWDYLPQARPVILDLMRRVGAYQLDRVLITRVRPGGRILPHADNEGGYVHEPDRARYHVVLQGGPENLFGCGGEVVAMHTGDIWWFDALTEHSVENHGTDDRIHMLVDLRCFL